MAKGQPIRVLLVRGGATQWDESGRLQGDCDLPLSSSGREKVCTALGSLKGVSLAAVYCAPDEASVETAALVGQAAGVKPTPMDDLREMNLGLWEGLSEADFEARFPRASRQWQDDPGSVAPPGGETFTQARDRVVATVERLLSRAKSGSAICLVLRPIALGTVRCWLGGEGSCKLWSQVEDCTATDWRLYGVTRSPTHTAGRINTPASTPTGAIRGARAV